MPKLKIYLERENKNKSVTADNVQVALKKLNINPTTVIVIKNNELVTLDSKLSSKDKIRIIPVISGG